MYIQTKVYVYVCDDQNRCRRLREYVSKLSFLNKYYIIFQSLEMLTFNILRKILRIVYRLLNLHNSKFKSVLNAPKD